MAENVFYFCWEKASKHPPSYQKHYSDYLKHPNPETFFISPATPDENKNIIKFLKSSKSVGPKQHTNKNSSINQRQNLYPPFWTHNKSFSTDCFPNICKTEIVIPIFKTESRLLCNNYRPISLLLNISKTIEK